MTISFKCADLGTQCRWAIAATSDAILMESISEHMVKDHRVKDIPEALKEKIKISVIHSAEY